MSAIERKILAHDADRLGLAGQQILAAIERVPELPHENAARRAGARGGDVDVGGFGLRGLQARRRAAFDDRHWLCSRERDRTIARRYSAFRPAALMIGHHLSISAWRSVPSASGECWSLSTLSRPISVMRFCSSGSAKPAVTAGLSLAIF